MTKVKQTATNTWSVMQRVRGKWRVVSCWDNEAAAEMACERFNREG